MTMPPTLKDNQRTTREMDSRNSALRTEAPATRTGPSSPSTPDDLPLIEVSNGWKTFPRAPRQNPTANMGYENPTETYLRHRYWQQCTGANCDSKGRSSSSNNTPYVEMIGSDLDRFSHSLLDKSGSAGSIASATSSSCSSPSTAPSNTLLCSEIHRKRQRVEDFDQPKSIRLPPVLRPSNPKTNCHLVSETNLSIELQSLKHRFLTHEMSSRRLLGSSPVLNNHPATQFPKADQCLVTDSHIHLCGDYRRRYIDRLLEKNTFSGQGSPSNSVTTPVTHHAGFQPGILRGSSLLTSTGRSESAYIPIIHEVRLFAPQDAPNYSPHTELNYQHAIARRTLRRAGAEAYRHFNHTSPTSGNDLSRGHLMDRHQDVDHSFTSSVLQKTTLEDPTFHEIHSKPTSSQDSIHSTAAEGALLAKETRTNYRGLPSSHEFTATIDAYLSALSSSKLPKALITQQLYKDIIFNLRREKDRLPGIGTPQFRFWCRKHFVLRLIPRLRLREQAEIPHSTITLPIGNQDHGDSDEVEAVIHAGQPVVTRETIYDVLSKCHTLANHAGRDKTTAIVKQNYSWVPKVLIGDFIKICPFCCSKKASRATWAHT